MAEWERKKRARFLIQARTTTTWPPTLVPGDVVGPSHWHWQASPIRRTTLPKTASRLLARLRSFTITVRLTVRLAARAHHPNGSTTQQVYAVQYTYTAIRTARTQERMSA